MGLAKTKKAVLISRILGQGKEEVLKEIDQLDEAQKEEDFFYPEQGEGLKITRAKTLSLLHFGF